MQKDQLLNHFFVENSWDKDSCQNIINKLLNEFDDGELYLQDTLNESIVFDDGRVLSSNYNSSRGFGLRGVINEISAYAHSTDFSEKSLLKAGEVISSIKTLAKPLHTKLELSHNKNNFYPSVDPLSEYSFSHKLEIAKNIDDYVRSKNQHVKQVSVRIYGSRSIIQVIKTENQTFEDYRPLVLLNISVTLLKDGKMEAGGVSRSYRRGFGELLDVESYQKLADEAIEIANTKLAAQEALAGEFTVVLGNGGTGVLLHEAVGHGLEGDFNRKKTSAFTEMMGKQVAAKGITVIDDGTIPESRGSLNIDDEGTSTAKNILIEDGVLVSYMQDRMNARLMNMKPTGNGRRESYAHQPMPRMTNTYMLAGKSDPQDLISSVKKGFYMPRFAGGQVDITSGKFVFEADLAYLIEDGKVTHPVKGATLIGNGPEVMKNIEAIGNDFKLSGSGGTCGKDGQSVPVGLGQPSLLISKITVGGTKLK